MARAKSVTIIRGQIDSATALRNVTNMAGDVPAVIEGSVLYPYIGFTARSSVPTMVGNKSMTVACLVDAINGLGATAESFSTEEIVASEELRLQSKITAADARRMAQRTVTHRLGKKLKMIAPFDVQLEATGIVFKRFWIMRVANDRIMADSVTGNMHPLRASAA